MDREAGCRSKIRFDQEFVRSGPGFNGRWQALVHFVTNFLRHMEYAAAPAASDGMLTHPGCLVQHVMLAEVLDLSANSVCDKEAKAQWQWNAVGLQR